MCNAAALLGNNYLELRAFVFLFRQVTGTAVRNTQYVWPNNASFLAANGIVWISNGGKEPGPPLPGTDNGIGMDPSSVGKSA